jgi:hypothetical protein
MGEGADMRKKKEIRCSDGLLLRIAENPSLSEIPPQRE